MLQLINIKFVNFVGNYIGAKVFSKMTEEEVNDPSLGFSFGGKKLLKDILARIKVYIRDNDGMQWQVL